MYRTIPVGSGGMEAVFIFLTSRPEKVRVEEYSILGCILQTKECVGAGVVSFHVKLECFL